MTIRFLNDWHGYKAGQTRTLSAAEETDALGDRVAVAVVAAPASPVEVRFDPATSSLLGPDGKPVSPVSGAGGPSYTWVNALAAAAAGQIAVNAVVRVLDVGPTACGSLMQWDGTYLRTLNGMQTLSAKRDGAIGAGIVSVAAAGKLALPAGPMVSSGSILLPIGLLRAGTGLRASFRCRHTGTAAAPSPALRLGTTNSASDNSFATCALANTDGIGAWAFSEANIVSSTVFVANHLMIPNGATNTPQNRTTNFDIAQQLYLSFWVPAVTAPDTVELLDYEIIFRD